jgi:ATP-dependent Clp protease ATP-binding subunit ClpC
VVLAQEEARSLKHSHVGTEHILLGLLREEEGIAARALQHLGVDLGPTRAHVLERTSSGEAPASGSIPFTPGARAVLDLALREALSLGDNHIDTAHILLGLVRERDGAGAGVLLEFGVGSEKVRDQVGRMLPRPGRPRIGAPADAIAASSSGVLRAVEPPDVRGISDAELDNRITALLNEERAVAYVARIVQDKLEILGAERERRRRPGSES